MTSDRPGWHAPLDDAARTWVEAVVGGSRRVVRARRLSGGIATAVDAVSLAAPDGSRRDVVLRRWLRPGWRDEDPRLTPSHEAAILRSVAGSGFGLPVPAVLGLDDDGTAAGAPALLLDRLPGRSPSRTDEATVARLCGYGEVLAAVHALDGPVRHLVVPFAPFYPVEPWRTPAATRQAGLWARAHQVVEIGPRDQGPPVLLHRDLHPANTLWSGARLTGVVDWTLASWGPAGADLGHLRANLGPRHGIKAADGSLTAYAAAAGAPPPDQAWWDIRMLLDWIDEPDALTPAELGPMEAYLEAVVQRA